MKSRKQRKPLAIIDDLVFILPDWTHRHSQESFCPEPLRKGSFCPKRPVSLPGPLAWPRCSLNTGASPASVALPVSCVPAVASIPYPSKGHRQVTVRPTEMHMYTPATCHVTYMCQSSLDPLTRPPEVSDPQIKNPPVFLSLEFQNYRFIEIQFAYPCRKMSNLVVFSIFRGLHNNY